MRSTLLPGVIAALLLVGCTGTFSGQVTTPSMVYIDSDVRVIEDYDEPIFYTNSFYWRQTGGVWYRSSHHNRGWVVYAAPPAIRRIERPSAYVHYRATAKGRGGRHEKESKRDHEDRGHDHKDHGRKH